MPPQRSSDEFSHVEQVFHAQGGGGRCLGQGALDQRHPGRQTLNKNHSM